jgi:outer membrane protein assembly factor BamB
MKNKILSIVLMIMLATSGLIASPTVKDISAASGSDCFATYKGDNHRDGVYSGTQINASGLIQTWEYKGDANLTNSPAVCGNRVFLAENSRMMTCIDNLTGKTLWQVEELKNFPVSCPSVYLGDQQQMVFLATGGQIERESVLYCFDANTGTELWKWEPNRTGTAGQICTGPTIVTYEDGLDLGQVWIIIGVNVSGGTALFALDAKTGVKQWGGSGIGLGSVAKADPVIAEGKIFHLTTDGLLHILELKTRKIISQTMLDDENTYEFHNTPAYANGILYCASRGKLNSSEKGKIYMVETATGNVLDNTFGIDQFNNAGPSIYTNEDDTSVLIGSDTGHIYLFDGDDLTMKYNVNIGKPVTTDIIISGKYGLLGAARTFMAINIETGSTMFSQVLGNTIAMHPVPCAGMVYIPCYDSRLYAFSDHDDFVLDVLPRTDAIYPSNKRSYKVVVTSTMEFDSPMVLRVSGLPNTLKASFSEPFVYPGLDEQEVELTIEATENAQPGNYICNIIGVLLGREKNTILQIQVLPPLTGDFKLSVSMDQLNPPREIEAGDSISYQIKVESIGGFSADISFYVNESTLPSYIDVDFMPTNLIPDGYVTAIISTDTSTQADKYDIEIQGHAGGKVRTTSVHFTVGGFDTDDWPMFQHDKFRTGAVKEPFPTNPELRFSMYVPDAFNLDWEGVRIRTQPIVALGKVYVVGEWLADEGTQDELNEIHESAIFALDSTTGEGLWYYKFNKSLDVDRFDKRDDLSEPVMSTPAVDVETGKLYVGSIDGHAYCLDAETGQKIWSRRTDPISAIRSPILLLHPDDEGINSKMVFFASRMGVVYAFSGTEDDKKLWEKNLPGHVISGLTYGYNRKENTGMVLVPCHDGLVYALKISNGAEVWKASVYNNEGIGTIAVDHDKGDWYIGGMMGEKHECWRRSQLQYRDLSNGDQHNFRATWGPIAGSPALFTNPTGLTTCHVNPNHGITNDYSTRTTVLWRLENENLTNLLDRNGRALGLWTCNDDELEINYSSCITDTENGTVVPHWDGVLYGYDKNGKELFKIKTEHPTKAHPTMARRMMYLPTEDGYLFAWAEKWGFGLAPETGSPVLCQGQPISLNIHFRSEIPLPRGVKFKVVQAPPDTQTSFTPESLGSSGVTSLFINAGEGCPEGTHTLIIEAEGSGFRRSTTFTVTVRKESPGDFIFTAEPSKIQIYAGEPAEVDFTIDAAGGFVGVVQMSVDGIPTGVVGSFSPIITTVPGKSKYKMNVAKNLEPGTYNLMFRAEGGCKAKAYPVELIVEPPVPGDYRSSLSDSKYKDIIMWLGEEQEVCMDVEFLDGYNLPVNFEVLNTGDFPGVDFEFVPSQIAESTTVCLKISTDFTGKEIDGKRVIIQTTSGRKAPKTQVQFYLTVKKTQGGFTLKPVMTNSPMQITAGQYAIMVFEYQNTTKFYTTTGFILENDCNGFEYTFFPERLSPSVHPQKVVCLIKIPRTMLDNDPEAKELGYKECEIQAFGIGGGLRVGSRPVNMRVYDPSTSPQRIYFQPEFKGLKNRSEDEVEIHIANLTDANSVQFDVLYDPMQLEIVGVEQGPIMNTDLKKAEFGPSEPNPDIGVLRISCMREQGAGPISGSGKFCTIKLRGKAVSQETSLKICNVAVYDEYNGYKPITGPTPGNPPMLRITISGNLPGDVDNDGIVGPKDLNLLKKTFGKKAGDPGFDGRADFNEDGIVDGMDLIILCMNWNASEGDTGPVP